MALVGTLLELALSMLLWWRFDPTIQDLQFVERTTWMPTFNIDYAVGVDGISVLLVLLTAVLSPLCILCAWTIDHHVKAFMSLVLLVEGAMVAVFTAVDVFLFFMSWEITMIPMYFMIILWGGPSASPRASSSCLYSLTGSLLLLVGILGMYVYGGRTFDWVELAAAACRRRHRCGSSGTAPGLCHQAAHGPAPLVAARRAFGSPDGRQCAPRRRAAEDGRLWLPALRPPHPPRRAAHSGLRFRGSSIAAILYGAYLALAQDDLKKLIAYSSISHMGFVTLGSSASTARASRAQSSRCSVTASRRGALPGDRPV